jgi:hypothetical protein
MMPKWMKIAMLGVGVLAIPAFGENPARPGAVNYVEGAVSLEGFQLNQKSVGSADVDRGQVLSTGKGKAEMLLTPGVFLRLDDNSAVEMISPDLTRTRVELERGRAGVEVDQIFPQNNLEVLDGGMVTQLMKTGYYEFDATNPTVMVFKGKAAVEIADGKYKVVKDNHEMALAQGAAKLKPTSFDTRAAQDELYNWNSLRSQYLAEGNNQIAGQYAGVAGFMPGWYWNPYMWNYTFIGMGPYFSPFGFGFYSPWYGGFYGGYYGGFRGGYYARGFAGGGFGGGFHGGGGRR